MEDIDMKILLKQRQKAQEELQEKIVKEKVLSQIYENSIKDNSSSDEEEAFDNVTTNKVNTWIEFQSARSDIRPDFNEARSPKFEPANHQAHDTRFYEDSRSYHDENPHPNFDQTRRSQFDEAPRAHFYEASHPHFNEVPRPYFDETPHSYFDEERRSNFHGNSQGNFQRQFHSDFRNARNPEAQHIYHSTPLQKSESMRDEILLEAVRALNHRHQKDHPNFNGDLMEWPNFIAEFNRTSNGILETAENLRRLNKAIQVS